MTIVPQRCLKRLVSVSRVTLFFFNDNNICCLVLIIEEVCTCLFVEPEKQKSPEAAKVEVS